MISSTLISSVVFWVASHVGMKILDRTGSKIKKTASSQLLNFLTKASHDSSD